ncbi:hypothetical protein AMQ84_00480 [Paenibacillus riograndensis]|uniref:RNA polymerase sigma-70 domain-containing protein n=1 Tax=Paenibacillus riograndensis TaxID=483937 RepID=A0A132UBZ1_9BACL|nr:hypothetical protein AMQ84_00480 [Paenibacillus riograndensis]
MTYSRVHNFKGEDMEDLISNGTIGLFKAIKSYRPNKGTKLATFAARCIENEILMFPLVIPRRMWENFAVTESI